MHNKNLWFAIALAYTIFIFIVSLISIKVDIATSFIHKDKVVHISIYVIYTILWFIYFNYNQETLNYKKVIFLAFTTGIVIEILQETLTKTRSADLLDILANGIGIAIAIQLIKRYYPKIKFML